MTHEQYLDYLDTMEELAGMDVIDGTDTPAAAVLLDYVLSTVGVDVTLDQIDVI